MTRFEETSDRIGANKRLPTSCYDLATKPDFMQPVQTLILNF